MRARLVPLAVVALFVLPGPAGAATFCVQGPCPSGGTTDASLSAAITSAGVSAGRDRIEIGPGTLTATNAGVGAGNPVDIVGAGQSATILAGNPMNTPVLTVNDPSSTVSDLTLRLGSGTDRSGLSLTGSSARRVVVDGNTGAVTTSTGASVLGGATLSASKVLLPNASPNIAVSASANLGEVSTIEDVEATGSVGVNASPAGTVNVRRIYVHDTSQGVRASETGTVNLSSSLIRVPGAFARALSVSTLLGVAPKLNVRHVTAVGDGSANSHGADAASGVAGRTAIIDLRDSTLQGFANAVFRAANAGTAEVSVSYSNYSAASVSSSNAGGGTGAVTTGAGNLDTDPLFADAAADFRLLPSSPLIEAGDPAAPGPADSTTDLAGSPRVADGNRDGAVRSDMGAYERQDPRLPPTVPAGPPAPDRLSPALSGLALSATRFRVGSARTPTSARRRKKKPPAGTTLRYRLSEAARVRITVQRRLAGRRIKRRGKRVCVRATKGNRKRANPRCTLYKSAGTLNRTGKPGANSIKFSGRIGSRKLPVGRYRLQVSATDAAGNRSRTRTLAFRIVR